MSQKTDLSEVTLFRAANGLFKRILKKSFVPGDEILTRANIIEQLEIAKKESPDPETFTATYEAVEKKFAGFEFKDLEFLYNFYFNREESDSKIEVILDEEMVKTNQEENKEEENMDDEVLIKNNKSEDLDFFNKKTNGRIFTLFINGYHEKEYQKIKHFTFENEEYVLLKDLDNNEEIYYQRLITKEDDKEVNKLLPVNDKMLIKMFDFLSL